MQRANVEAVVLSLPNRFEKPKAGGAILITVKLAQMLIQRTNVALVANDLWYEIETDSTTAPTMRLSNQRFCFIPLVS